MWPGVGGRESLDALTAAGVHRAVTMTMALGPDPLAGMERLAAEVIG